MWGDPALARATLRLAGGLAAHFHAEVEVPGSRAPQILAAAHRIALGGNESDMFIVSAQRLVDSYEPAMGEAVVFGDDRLQCLELADLFPDLELYWGRTSGLRTRYSSPGACRTSPTSCVRRAHGRRKPRGGWWTPTCATARGGGRAGGTILAIRRLSPTASSRCAR